MTKDCGASDKYFASIDECIPLDVAGKSEFLSSYQSVNRCPGGAIRSTTDLEGLRFCQAVSGGLTISVYDDNADFSALYDIVTIQGLCLIIVIVFVACIIYECTVFSRIE